MLRYCFAITTLILCAMCGRALGGAQPEVVLLTGTASLFTSTTNPADDSGGPYTITIDVRPTTSADPDDIPVVVVQSPEDITIESITVRVYQATSGPNKVAKLVVRPKGNGRLLRLGSVLMSNQSSGELVIQAIETQRDVSDGQGNVGSTGSTRGGQIEAHRIESIRAGGNVTADILVKASSSGVSANLVFLQTAGGGHLLGDIDVQTGTDTGFIRTLDISGDIGNSSLGVDAAGQTKVQARGDVSRISAANIYGNIDISRDAGTTLGNLRYLKVTGNLAGRVKCRESVWLFGSTVPAILPETYGVEVDGDLSGEYIATFASLTPITVLGEVTGTIQIDSIATDRPMTLPEPNDPFRDTDFSVGAVSASGAIIVPKGSGGPMTINGDVAPGAVIEIGPSVAMGTSISLNDLVIDGEIQGVVRLTGSLPATSNVILTGGVAIGGTLSIGGTLNGDIEIPADTLAGQIIINANNVGGAWNGQVRIGTGGSTIDIPASPTTNYHGRYAQLPSQLGGGSIGLAPFQLHEEACTPIHNDPSASLATIFDSTNTDCGRDEPVVIRSYGPITKDTLATWMETISIEATMDNDDCGWQDASLIFAASPSTNPAEGGRALVIRKSNPAAKDPARLRYRVVPRSGENAILSRDVAGTPQVVWPLSCASDPAEAPAYRFALLTDCNGNCVLDTLDILETPSLDQNSDGLIDDCQDAECRACDYADDNVLDLLDLLAFNADWSANLGQSVPAGTLGDVNSDGTVDLLDLLEFLGCWTTYLGTPCT